MSYFVDSNSYIVDPVNINSTHTTWTYGTIPRPSELPLYHNHGDNDDDGNDDSDDDDPHSS